MRTILAALAVVFIIGPLPAPAAERATSRNSNDGDVLATLRKSHPRLLVLDEDVTRLRGQVENDPTAKAWFGKLKQAGEAVMTQPVSTRVLTGPRLLGVSRTVLGRVTTLAGLYRLTGDKRYSERARDEMLAVAKFVDWHPPHFLDVAEMTNAMGIGYDWLYDVLTPTERAEVRNAIVEKGLKPGLVVYASGKGFPTNTNNWNQVCNGGLTVGALAVADEEPDVARKVIENARKTIDLAMRQFAPDGGFIEGPGYWCYATRYTAFYLSALQTALGTDFGYLKTPGLAETPLFRIHSLGPLDRTFNFADAHDTTEPASQMFYFARAFKQPAYAAHERQLVQRTGKFEPFDLLWYDAEGGPDDLDKLPTAAVFRRVQVVFLRSAWNDRDAAFVGFKGGDNRASHAHLDLGTFVYDAAGARWAQDLGPDDYNLPGYFGGQRYDYYRLRTEGHNTLTLDGQPNQPVKATAPIIAFSDKPGGLLAVADLSKGYPMAQQVRRGVRLIKRQLLVQDEIRADAPVDVTWNFHTPAKIAIETDARHATLTQGKKRLTATILAPADARFEIAPSDIPPTTQSTVPTASDRSRKPGQKLIARTPAKVKDLRLVVLLSPEGETAAEVKVEPLDTWIEGASLSSPGER